jgi:hypothetical protein
LAIHAPDLSIDRHFGEPQGEDGEYLDAMRKANIKGALVGVEAVTPEGLKAVFKDWNYSGEALARQLQSFRQHGVHVLGSSSDCRPTSRRHLTQRWRWRSRLESPSRSS